MMLRGFQFIIAVLILLSLGNCKKYSAIEGLDSEAWKADRNGCNSTRYSYLPVIRKNEEYILGLTTSQIAKVFGKPDLVELYVRNQKYYVYYLQPANVCKGFNSGKEKPVVVKIRFEALGRATEVVYENL